MMNKSEQKVIDDVKMHGCHVMQVMEGGGYPPYSYSIGIKSTYQKPDLCIMGLKEKLAISIINRYAGLLGEKRMFEAEEFYSGFLEGFDVCFKRVSKKYFQEYFGWAVWYYEGAEFEMMQMVYPSTSGFYPWSKGVTENFLRWQPVLTDTSQMQ